MPGSSDFALASMGVYIFDTDILVRALEADANRQTTHDFGKDIIPALIHTDPRLRLPLLRREQEGLEVLARYRNAGRLLRSQHGPLPGEPGVQPVRSGVAASNAPAAGAAGKVRVRRSGTPVRAGARFGDLSRLHRLGQHDSGQRALPQRARAQLLPRRSEHPDARRARRPPRADSACDHRPRRAHSQGRAHRLSPRRRSTASYGDRFGRGGRHNR